MEDGTKLNFEQLCNKTCEVVKESGKSQSEIAATLNVHRSAISRAIKTPGEKFQELQRRIIAHLTPYCVERHIVFKVKRIDPQ